MVRPLIRFRLLVSQPDQYFLTPSEPAGPVCCIQANEIALCFYRLDVSRPFRYLDGLCAQITVRFQVSKLYGQSLSEVLGPCDFFAIIDEEASTGLAESPL